MFISQQQVVSEPMVVCNKGCEVFKVPTHQGQKKPKQPTYKDPGEEEEQKKKKNAQQRNIANGAK